MCIRDRSTKTFISTNNCFPESDGKKKPEEYNACLLYKSPSQRDHTRYRMPSSALKKQQQPRSKRVRSSAASDVYKRQINENVHKHQQLLSRERWKKKT